MLQSVLSEVLYIWIKTDQFPLISQYEWLRVSPHSCALTLFSCPVQVQPQVSKN